MIRQAGDDADPTPAPARRRSRVKRIVAAAASATIAAASLMLAGTVPAQAATTVHTYAPTGVGGGTTTSPDQASTKYQVQVAGTPVQAVRYTANRNNFDIARFASDSRTPTITVTLPSTTIDTVNVYPARYYPPGSVSVSADKHTLTFQMSADAGLNQAIVMVNGDSTSVTGQPYLAVINDPLEDPAQRPNTASASDGSGVNLQTGVLNFQEFAAKYLVAHPNSTAQQAPAATTSSMAGKTVDGTAIPAGQKTSAGTLVSASSTNVRYPNVRTMAADDVTYALKAAIDTIKANPTALNTLYFPNGTYVWSGLMVNGVDGSKLKGGKLKIYTDDGALLKNRIQGYMEAFEPAVGIINSSNIEIDGRGVYDGNGVANYRSDSHDAYRSQHQGGVMVMHSSDITFNETYLRDSKQWNWETHTAKRVTFNNIKGLTPYPQPWIDGTDFASGQDITANGVFTLGNDDAFASGHYNPSDGFTPMAAGVWGNFQLGTATPDIQGYANAAGAHDAVADELGFDSYHWDNADSKNISVSDTLSWSSGAGNSIRIGWSSWGYKLNNYTFDNFNSISQGGRRHLHTEQPQAVPAHLEHRDQEQLVRHLPVRVGTDQAQRRRRIHPDHHRRRPGDLRVRPQPRRVGRHVHVHQDPDRHLQSRQRVVHGAEDEQQPVERHHERDAEQPSRRGPARPVLQPVPAGAERDRHADIHLHRRQRPAPERQGRRPHQRRHLGGCVDRRPDQEQLL
ncbi:hypothetical protein [Streptomyces sp. SLBN-8D4]|uniref:hypothetical protein n=1 Tax=Streptomyces sp. SLBN-8D4 TaxID=3377728 RepID=UPI003C7A0FB3